MASSTRPDSARHIRARDQRGASFPSPLVMVSVIAIALAGVAFFATDNERPPADTAQTSSGQSVEPTPDETDRATKTPDAEPAKKKKKEKKPEVVRGETYVEVYNNSSVTGLAAAYAGDATSLGWQVVAEDNWYGVIPASTVYYPNRLEAAATQLALDLGIERLMPAVDPMNMDRLTVILTAGAA